MDSNSSLLKLLFPNGIPGIYPVVIDALLPKKAIFAPAFWETSPNFNNYISKLGSYKIDDLVREPVRLEEEKTSIQQQTQELAISNYKTFIETAQCSRDMFNKFTDIETKLNNLLENTSNFEAKCYSFGDEANKINDMRRLNSLTLTKSGQLLEILELPQLMNSFINDGSYEDALELASYVRQLYRKHPEIPIFKDIVADVDKSWLLMLHQLLGQLRQDLSLPKCLQIVSHLRRMEVFTETELRLKFLQTRNVWLQSCLGSIPKDDASYHLNKTTEITRVHLFNIITQYKAIFNDDEHSPLASFNNDQVNQNVIFFTWIRDKISEFLNTLESDLDQGVSSLDSILAQCMYFGVSFGKVGCDFRLLIIPIFTKKIGDNFQKAVDKAVNLFSKNMERFTLINKNYPNVPWKTKIDDPLQPPDTLLEFYPLAEFLNNVLNAFNELKLCAPFATIQIVVESLQNALNFIAKSILVLHGQEQQAFNAGSKDAFMRLCICFADDLVPYIQKCIHIIYVPTDIAIDLKVSMEILQSEGVTFLKKDVIVEPIKHLLPPKIDPFLKNTPESDPREIIETNNVHVVTNS